MRLCWDRCGQVVLLAGLVLAATAPAASAVVMPRVPATDDHGAEAEDSRIALLEALVRGLQAEVTQLRDRDREQQELLEQLLDGTVATRRRAQRAGGGQTVSIYTRQLTRHPDGGPGRGLRRRAQATSGQMCDATTVSVRAAAVTAMCCDEPDEDCSAGHPATCNADCSDVLLPYFTDCQLAMPAEEAKVLHGVLQLCQVAIVEREEAAGESLAMQLLLSCDTGAGADVDDCVPVCSEALHGDLLLANIDGEDSKYSCELHHGQFSWMGAASDGGYLGRDSIAFLSSLLSGAAGAYILTVIEDADINTDARIEPGMHVSIIGDAGLPQAPAWGTGSLWVGDQATLAVEYILLDLSATITVVEGGNLALSDMTIHASALEWAERAGSTLKLSHVEFVGPSFVIGDPCSAEGASVHPMGSVIGGDEPVVGSGVIEFLPDGGYGNDVTCTWTLACDNPTIEFTELGSEECCDKVHLFGASTEMDWSGSVPGEHISGELPTPRPEYTAPPGAPPTLVFTSDPAGNGKGFVCVCSPRLASDLTSLRLWFSANSFCIA
jgi:hypothetical protein